MSSGFLGTRATWVADINLILQIVLLGLIVVGALRAARGRFATHHTLMSAAVLIQAVSIIAMMNPAFFRVLPFAWRTPTAPGPTVMWPHVALGTLAELLGVYIVARLRLDPTKAARLRGLMVLTLLIWVVALIAGIAVYRVWHAR